MLGFWAGYKNLIEMPVNSMKRCVLLNRSLKKKAPWIPETNTIFGTNEYTEFERFCLPPRRESIFDSWHWFLVLFYLFLLILSLWELVLSFYPVDPGLLTHVLRFGSKCLHPILPSLLLGFKQLLSSSDLKGGNQVKDHKTWGKQITEGRFWSFDTRLSWVKQKCFKMLPLLLLSNCCDEMLWPRWFIKENI